MTNLSRAALLTAVVYCLLACTPSPEQQSRHERSPSRTQVATIAHDGSVALIATSEHDIQLIDLTTQQSRYHWRFGDEVSTQVISVALAPDNSVALAADRERLVTWDIASGDVTGYWRMGESTIQDVAVSNQGRHIIIGRADGVVLVFEPETGRRLEFFGHSERVNSVDVSANGRYVISGGDDHRALVWRSDNAQLIQEFPSDGRVNRVLFNPDGSTALAASAQVANIWHLTRGDLVSELRHRSRHNAFTSAGFSADGTYLVTGSPSRHLDVWRVVDGVRVMSTRVKGRSKDYPPRATVVATAFSPDGRTVFSENSAGFGESWSVGKLYNDYN